MNPLSLKDAPVNVGPLLTAELRLANVEARLAAYREYAKAVSEYDLTSARAPKPFSGLTRQQRAEARNAWKAELDSCRRRVASARGALLALGEVAP